jgi:hypothetical protein
VLLVVVVLAKGVVNNSVVDADWVKSKDVLESDFSKLVVLVVILLVDVFGAVAIGAPRPIFV